MAIVKKCDRCGMIYDNYDGLSDYEKGNGVATIVVNNTGTGNFTWKSYDLCKVCMNEYRRFMRNDLKENNNAED